MRDFYIPNELKNNLPALKVLFNALKSFSNLPLGLNPKSRREFEAELSAIKNDPSATIGETGKLIKKMKVHKESYAWRKSWHEKFNTEAFWSEQSREIQLKRPKWRRIEPFSYYNSADIAYLSFHVLPRIKEQIRVARKHFGTRFPEFIQHSNQQLKYYREAMAQAMLARLQIVASHQDLKNDDVIYHFLDELSLVDDLLTRPKHITAPKKQLSRQDFLRFHQYIEKHANPETLREFNCLPWQQENALQKSPSRLRSPRWLFRGHNARYHAFYDRYHQISLLLVSKTSDPFQAYHAFTLEQKRLHALKEPLNRFFQRSTLRVLRQTIDLYKAHRKKILERECHLLSDLINKEHMSESDINEAEAALKALSSLDKTDFPKIEENVKTLSDQLIQKSKTHDKIQNSAVTEQHLKYEFETHLGSLLDPNAQGPHYLNKLSQLKIRARKLPETIPNKSVKRLFKAGTGIRNIINALPEALIALFEDEVDQLPMLNQLLVDIIDAKLIFDDEKENLIQLLNIVCKKTNLNPELVFALNAFKNLLMQTETEHDRKHILQYENCLKKMDTPAKISSNIYTLSNTNLTVMEAGPSPQPTIGV